MTNGAKKTGAKKSAAKRSPAKRAASRPAGAAAGLGRRVRAWCDAEEHLSVSGERKDKELDLAMQIDASGAQYGRAEVRMAKGADRVSIVRAWALAPGTSSEQETSLLGRVGKSAGRLPGLIRYHVRRGGTWPVLEMEATVYLDGLSQHAFMSTLDDLMQAAAVVQPQIERAGGRDALTAAPADEAVGATTQQAPQAPPAAAVAFAPTHRIPRSGLPAWAAPDPNGQVVAQLQGGVELQVLEERGAWAHVLGSNGWKGWVDGRQLKKAS
jgi:hypothetical protein